MRTFKARLVREDGWTFIEATLSVVIMSMMILGLTIVLLAFREHLDRSWAIRVMDQYGNDVIERLTHELRNAVDVTVRPGGPNTNRIEVKYLDPWVHDLFHTTQWRADLRTNQILLDNRPIDPKFPPRMPGRGERYVIERFTLTPYGQSTPNDWEHRDMYNRSDNFMKATWEINFKLLYVRNAIDAGDRNWTFEKEYFNRVYMRNKNLAVQKGITD
jgi:hypothetical protein